MKIVVSHYHSGKVYMEIPEPTASEVAAYSGSNVIIVGEGIAEVELSKEWVVMDVTKGILSILVSEEQDELIEPSDRTEAQIEE
jgi:hypothetical protein